MKLFSFSRRAISSFSFDAGTSTRRCFDPHALRIRVNMSAIGSVMLIGCLPSSPMVSGWSGLVGSGRKTLLLPRRLPHARDQPRQRHLPERDPAQAEHLDVAARPAGHRAPVADALGCGVARERAERHTRPAPPPPP